MLYSYFCYDVISDALNYPEIKSEFQNRPHTFEPTILTISFLAITDVRMDRKHKLVLIVMIIVVINAIIEL